MAATDITYQIGLKDTDGTEFNVGAPAGAAVRLMNSNVAGTAVSPFGLFTPVGHGLWSIQISDQESGYYRVESYTTASGAYAAVPGMSPLKIELALVCDLATAQTVAGAKIFSGACEVTGAWTVAGTVDFTKDKLKIGGTTVTASAAELNILDEVTATKDELNILAGVTATKDEINILAGVTAVCDLATAQTVAGAKIFSGACIVTGAWTVAGTVNFVAGTLKIAGTTVTASAAEINKLSVTTGGEVDASKVLVADAYKNVDFDTGSTTETNNTVKGILVLSGTENITASGALSLEKTISDIDSSSGIKQLTLADGTIGQIKVCVMSAYGFISIITPGKFVGGTNITMSAVGDSVTLMFATDGWFVIGQNNIVIIA